MGWPWVSTRQLADMESFWREENKRCQQTISTCILHIEGYVDRIIELERINEGKSAHTVAVGLVPWRTDGLISLHIGRAFVELSPVEARRLAADLLAKAAPK